MDKKSKKSFTLLQRKPQTGFTLIEIIIVIVIIGILAGIALPRYGKMTEHSRIPEALTILSSIQKAEKRYAVEHGEYAFSFADLDINVTEDGKFFGFELITGGIPPTPYDAIDSAIAIATRNGIGVTGGYDPNYWISISENGNFTSGTEGGGGGFPPIR